MATMVQVSEHASFLSNSCLDRCKTISSLQIEDNHVIKYIPQEEWIKTVVAQKRLRPRVHEPGKFVTRGTATSSYVEESILESFVID